jgi:hypothetical protein
MATSRSTEHVEPATRRGGRGAANFIGHWQVWIVALPLVGTGCFLIGGGWRVHVTGTSLVIPIGLFSDAARAEIIWLTATASTGLALFVIGAGLFARKRLPFVVAHLALSTWFAGILISVTTTVGWPLWWAIAHGAISGAFAVSWNYYRSDALRGDPREKSEDQGELGQLFGIPRTKIGQPRIDEYAVRASIKPGMGETLDDVEKAVPKIEEAADYAIPGRTRVERDPDTGKAELVIQHTDPLRTWPRWTGPSKPGGSFADGAVCGVYEDGQPERYWQAGGLCADGAPRQPGHLGRMGMTRSGKSGCAAVAWTDMVFTSRDALMVYVDCAKPEQSMAGQIMDDLTLYADTPAKSRALFKALMRLAKDRAARMGRAGFRDWTPDVYRRLGIPALLVVVDEADKVIGTKLFTDLATTVLSAGIYLDVILPRADGESMPTTVRFSISMWQCFGTGDDYSHTMVIPDSIATAHPDLWGNTKPGYHYLVKAPGVDERRWSLVARSYRAEFDELAAAIRAGRRYRAALPPADIAALGSTWKLCQPGRRARPADVPDGAWDLDDEAEAQPVTSTDSAATDGAAQTEEWDMDDDSEPGGRYADEDERIPPPAMRDAEPGDTAAYAGTDPREEITEHHGVNDVFDDPTDTRPAPPDHEAAMEAFDLTLRQMARDGIEVFSNGDVIERYPFKQADSTMSRRMSQVCEGDIVLPPGLTIERLGRGRYRLIREPVGVIAGDVV